MQNEEDWEELCAFLRRSRYSVIQVHAHGQWGRAWTFAPCDIHAAERVGRQMRRVYGTQVRLRYARCARLTKHRQQTTAVGMITEIPGGHTIMLDLETGLPITDAPEWVDEPLLALEQALGQYKITSQTGLEMAK